MREHRAVYISAAALFACGVLLASGSLHNPWVLDDVAKIVENPDLRDLGRLPATLIYPYTEHQLLNRNDPSRPVVFATYALNYAAGGLSPFGYHLVNALLHALNGVLVFLLARRLLKGRAGELPTALLAALLFVSAPINMGTAIYVYGRSDLMQATWLLLAALIFPAACAGRRDATAGLVAIYIAGLFTKQSMVVLPVLLLAYDYLGLARRDAKRVAAHARVYVPLVAVTLAYFVFREVYFGTLGDVEGRGNLWAFDDYVSVQPYVIARYLALALVPVGLSIDHQVLPFASPFAPVLLLGWVVLAALGVGIAYALKRRGESAASLALAGLWFLVCLAPTSSLLPTVDAMVERRTYAANVGLYFAVALLAQLALAELARPWPRVGPVQGRLYALLMGSLVVMFSLVALARNRLHSDEEALWKDVITNYPKSVRAHNNLANIYQGRRQFADAIAIYEKLTLWNPQYYIEWNNLGNAYAHEDNPRRDVERALWAFEKAMTLNPSFAEPYYNVGRVYQQRDEIAAAATLYQKALALDPNHVLAHNNLGLLYFHQGKHDEAKREYEAALRIDPAHPAVLANLELLAKVAGESGKVEVPAWAQTSKVLGPQDLPTEVLVPMFEEALRRDPKDRELRVMYARECLRRKLACAKEQFGVLASQEPDNTEFRQALDSLR